MHREPHQLVAVHLGIVGRGGVGDDGENVLVGDVLLLVAEDFELLEAARKLFVRQLVPHFLQPRGESVLAGVLAQHDVIHADADGFGRENLVGLLVCQNTVLMDATFVPEGVDADNRLGQRRALADDVVHGLAGRGRFASCRCGRVCRRKCPGVCASPSRLPPSRCCPRVRPAR